MVIYNMTVKADTAVAEDCLRWMRREYIPLLMATGLFLDWRLCRLIDPPGEGGETYVTQLFLASMEDFRTYSGTHAQALETRLESRFGEACTAFRTLMEEAS